MFWKYVLLIIEITLWHACSPVNLLHIFRTPFSKNTSGWLLLLFIENSPSFTRKLKSYKCRQKKYLEFVLASLQGCITVGSYRSAEFFYFFKCIINTNSWKLKRSLIGEMSDSNDTWIPECYKFENCFQCQTRYFFSKKVDLFKLWDLQVFN